MLASANESSAKTLAAAFREPRATSLSTISTAAADTVTRAELNEKFDQMDDRFCQRLETLESKRRGKMRSYDTSTSIRRHEEGGQDSAN
jgi:hypothetical protein